VSEGVWCGGWMYVYDYSQNQTVYKKKREMSLKPLLNDVKKDDDCKRDPAFVYYFDEEHVPPGYIKDDDEEDVPSGSGCYIKDDEEEGSYHSMEETSQNVMQKKETMCFLLFFYVLCYLYVSLLFLETKIRNLDQDSPPFDGLDGEIFLTYREQIRYHCPELEHELEECRRLCSS
jgi:hypothetical protein